MRRELFNYDVFGELAFDIPEGKLAKRLKPQLQAVPIQYLAVGVACLKR